MSPEDLVALADDLRQGSTPDGVEILKRNPVRVVGRRGDAVLKVFLAPSRRARREARALEKARARGLPVPELLGYGSDWVATGWCRGREAERADLPDLLRVVGRMHRSGMLHGDLHLGNVLVCDGAPLLLDLHRARFVPVLPGVLRRRELGFLAYSCGEPLPESLGGVRFWRDRRAHTHWRSRTRRATLESSGFTRFDRDGEPGFRRRAADPAVLEAALAGWASAERIKDGPTRVFRSAGLVLKEHASMRAARRAWVAGHGLDARDIRTARALAWSGRWLVMEDAGATLYDWIVAEFEKTSRVQQEQVADALADLLAALHRRGIYHADLKANNVCTSAGEPPRLLDYGRVDFGRRVSRRRRIKNLAQLNAALPDVFDAALRERALRRYTDSSGYDDDVDALRRAVVDLSLRRRHHWSGC